MRWNSWRGLFLLVILLAGVAALAGTLAGTLAGRWASPETRPGAKPRIINGLLIDPSALDFGEVWGNQDFAIQLPVTNVTDRAIHIDEFHSGCDCRPIEPKSFTLAPGETREIRLMFDPAKLSPAMIGRPRLVDTEIRPVLHGKPASKTWKVRGTIRPLISTDLSAVLFGESNRVGQTPVARRVRVQFHDAGVPGVELTPPVAEVRVLPGSGPTEWTVVVTPITDRAPGPFRGTLTITNWSPDDNRAIASLSLPVEGVLREGDK